MVTKKANWNLLQLLILDLFVCYIPSVLLIVTYISAINEQYNITVMWSKQGTILTLQQIQQRWCTHHEFRGFLISGASTRQSNHAECLILTLSEYCKGGASSHLHTEVIRDLSGNCLLLFISRTLGCTVLAKPINFFTLQINTIAWVIF